MKDLQKAHPVLANEWYGRSIFRKFVEGVTWPIHKFL
jgi:hypothetical protein